MISIEDLRKIRLLSSLDDGELEQLSKVLREQKVREGNYIFHEAEPAPSIMFIAEGGVKVTLMSREGKEIVVATLTAGDFFGEIALLTGEDRSANVIADQACRLLVLGQDEFHRHLLEQSGLALNMLQELAFRLRAATNKIGDLALYDVYCRVARTLKQLSKLQKLETGKDAYVVEKRPTHQELASMVGTSREMVTRALKDLEEDGYIHTEGKEVVIVGVPG